MKKVSVAAYLDWIEEIYRENPEYQTGGDGSGGKCDCIGMCRGALERSGAEGVWNMRGTNNAARNGSFLNLREIRSAGELQLGDVVLKTRSKDDKSMPLPDKYRKGGSQYSAKWGETNWTHIGTVTGLHPLEITHMTSPHPKKDTSLSGWSWAAELPWVEYSEKAEPAEPDPEQEDKSVETAVVWSANGGNVKLRAGKSPGSGSYRLYDEVPVGTSVEVLEHGDKWCKVSCGRRKGWYMMTEFLKFGGATVEPGEDPEAPAAADGPEKPAADPETVEVTLTLTKREAELLLKIADNLGWKLTQITGGLG